MRVTSGYRFYEVTEEDETRVWEVSLEPEIAKLFGHTYYTKLDWALRLSLPDMAKWLHAFYATHEEPYPHNVRKLYQLTGSKIKEFRHFRRILKRNLETLVEKGFLSSAHITDEDLVVVVRA